MLPFFLYCCKCRKKSENNKSPKEKKGAFKKIFVALCVSFYSLQPTIMSVLVELSICEDFNFGSFLKSNLVESCNSSRYLIFYYYFVLPLLIIFSAVFPLFVIVYIWTKNKKGLLFNPNIYKKIGFLLIGYKKNTYFW